MEEITDNEGLKFYKSFIDDLLGWPSRSVKARHVREYGTLGPKTYSTSEEFNRKMEMFTFEQRQIIAGLMQECHETGVFDAVVYLDEGYELMVRVHDDNNENGYKLVTLPVRSFGEEMHDDLVSRRMGFAWPDEEDEEIGDESRQNINNGNDDDDNKLD